MSVATAMPLTAGASKQSFHVLIPSYVDTTLDKTVEKVVYLGSIFLNIIAVLVLPSPPSPESSVVAYSKESLIPGCL